MPRQLELLKPEMEKLDVATVAKQPSMTGAIILCQTLSGLDDKQLCGKGGVINDAATWSRIKGGSNNFPQDELNRLMNLCGNEAPLIWLANSRGYDLVPQETEWERQYRIEREARIATEKENALLRTLIQGKAV